MGTAVAPSDPAVILNSVVILNSALVLECSLSCGSCGAEPAWSVERVRENPLRRRVTDSRHRVRPVITSLIPPASTTTTSIIVTTGITSVIPTACGRQVVGAIFRSGSIIAPAALVLNAHAG